MLNRIQVYCLVGIIAAGLSPERGFAQQPLPIASPFNSGRALYSPGSNQSPPVLGQRTIVTPGLSQPATITQLSSPGPIGMSQQALLSGPQPAINISAGAQSSVVGQASANMSARSQSSRPTNPMLQNMSNPSNLSHVGITDNQQMAPNLYFGRPFDNWSDLQDKQSQPAVYGEMSRFQPYSFNGYVMPNDYVGPRYSTWNNLSSGTVTPHPFGSWSMSPW